MIAFFLAFLLLWADACPAAVPDGGAEDEACPALRGCRWQGRRVAFLGDSITDKKRIGTDKCYWEYLAEWLGLVPCVYALNGNRMDGVLRQARQLRAERGDSIDAVIVFAGTNDYNAGVPLGEWYTYGECETEVKGGAVERRLRREPVRSDSTFRGRINLLMEYLKTNYPEKQVILLTPLHRAYARFGGGNVQPDESFPNRLGLYVDAYVEAVKEAANVWAVPVIDLNSLSGLYPLADSHARYFHDGETDRLHPNAKGHERMAKALACWMQAFPAAFD